MSEFLVADGFGVRSIAVVFLCFAGAALAQDAQLKARDPADKRVVLDVVARPTLTNIRDVKIVDNGVAVAPDHLQRLSPGERGGERVSCFLSWMLSTPASRT